MLRLLVTGANGFLGRRVIEAAQGRHELAAHVRGPQTRLHGVEIHYADLADPKAVRAMFREAAPGAVIHAAALSSPNACQQDPETSRAVNAEASALLARLAAEAGARMVFVSTDLVFNGENPPYREDDPVSPLGVYAEHKAVAERAVLELHPGAVVARMPLMFGALPGSQSFLEPMIKTLAEGREATLFSDEFRTPVSGRTAAEGLLLALSLDYAGILHLGGRQRASRLEIGRLATELAGLPATNIREARQKDVPMPAPRPPDVSLDSSRAFGLGYSPGSLREELALALGGA